MNNVVALNRQRTLDIEPATINPFPSESKLYFNVHAYDMSLVPKLPGGEREEFYTGEQSYNPIVPSHKALVRNVGGNPHPIAVVGRKYNVVQNKELFQKLEEQFMLALSDRELQDAKVKDSLSYMGQTCIREYIFPNVRCKTQSKSDIAFRTVVVNGFGGSSFKLMVGAIDFFCANGMVIGEYDAYYHRHTKGLSITNVVERVRRSVEVFYKQADIWQAWMGKHIGEQDVTEFFKSLPGMSERRADQLTRQFYIEARSHGHTVWALYSALTYFATHDEGVFKVRDTGNDNTAATLLKREEQVKRWTETKEWKEMAA